MLMRISKARIDQYRDELNTLADLASDYVKAFVELMLQENPNIGVAELRQATIEAIEESLNVFGVEASSLAGELFDEIMLGEGISAKAAVGRTIEAEAVDKKVRTYAQELVNGNAAAFTKKVTDITHYYIKREAYQSMIDNCERNDVRWARVPSGRETCSFCFMLSSRGFVYLSEEKARGTHGMHRNCDCVVVPGIDGVTKIAGYDPKGMRDQWNDCARTVGVDPEKPSAQKTKEILREVERRDWTWLYSGKMNKRRRFKCDPEWEKHEKDTAEILFEHGFGIDHIKRSYEFRQRKADTFLNGEKWEMKSPQGAGYMSIHNTLKKAVFGSSKQRVRNPQSSRLVISNLRSTMTLDEMEHYLRETENDPFETFPEIKEVLLVSNEGVRRVFRFEK